MTDTAIAMAKMRNQRLSRNVDVASDVLNLSNSSSLPSNSVGSGGRDSGLTESPHLTALLRGKKDVNFDLLVWEFRSVFPLKPGSLRCVYLTPVCLGSVDC